jgi:hypothetical protein
MAKTSGRYEYLPARDEILGDYHSIKLKWFGI